MIKIRIKCGPTNKDKLMLIDQARRLADHVDISAKSGQTNNKFKRLGHIDLSFRGKRAAVAYLNAVDEYCDSSVVAKIIK